MIESSSNGDLLNTDEVWCRYRTGRVVTSDVLPCKTSPHYASIKPILFNNLLNHKVEFMFWKVECLKMAKRFGPCQPTRTAQADMNRYFSEMY